MKRIIQTSSNRLNIKSLKDNLYAAASRYMRSLGYTLSDIVDYLTIDIENTKSYYKVYVYAELDFDDMRELADQIDPIVQRYDKNSYFDNVDPGIMVAVISNSDKILYVIKDRNGRQLSAPNPDSSVLWDRVYDMESKGKTGLSVVVY